MQENSAVAAPEAVKAESKTPTKQKQPKRRKFSSTSAGASGSQNPQDAENRSLQPQTGAHSVQEPKGTPTGKARSTRSNKSLKHKHVLHVAEEAASLGAEDEAAAEPVPEAESVPTEAGPSQPARRPRRSQTPSAVVEDAGANATVAPGNRATATAGNVQAPFVKMPPYRTMMLSAVGDAPYQQPPSSKPSKAKKIAKTKVAGGLKSQLADLADALAGNSTAEQPEKV